MRGWRFVAGFAALLTFDSLGQIAFKLVAEHTAPLEAGLDVLSRLAQEPWALAILLSYAGAFLTYMTLIRDAPIGPLFAASHLEIVVVAGISVVAFGERLAPLQILGCLTIVGGLLILAATEPAPDKEPKAG